MNNLNHDNKNDELLKACEELIEALTQSTETLWENSLQESHSCVLWDKSTLQPSEFDEGGESKTYPGIFKEVIRLNQIMDFCRHRPDDDTLEGLEKRGYYLEEFAVDDIVDKLYHMYDEIDGYDVCQVTDFVKELMEMHGEDMYGVDASDTDERMMDGGDVDIAYEMVSDEIEKIHEYIRTGGF